MTSLRKEREKNKQVRDHRGVTDRLLPKQVEIESKHDHDYSSNLVVEMFEVCDDDIEVMVENKLDDDDHDCYSSVVLLTVDDY